MSLSAGDTIWGLPETSGGITYLTKAGCSLLDSSPALCFLLSWDVNSLHHMLPPLWRLYHTHPARIEWALPKLAAEIKIPSLRGLFCWGDLHVTNSGPWRGEHFRHWARLTNCLLCPGHLTKVTLAPLGAGCPAWPRSIFSKMLKTEMVLPLSTKLQTGMETGAQNSY